MNFNIHVLYYIQFAHSRICSLSTFLTFKRFRESRVATYRWYDRMSHQRVFQTKNCSSLINFNFFTKMLVLEAISDHHIKKPTFVNNPVATFAAAVSRICNQNCGDRHRRWRRSPWRPRRAVIRTHITYYTFSAGRRGRIRAACDSARECVAKSEIP